MATPLKLSHYVYSSLEGYRTIYASDDLPAGLVSSLEALAKRTYRPAQTRDIFAWLGTDDDLTCVVKAFQNGTDHAGRRRSCVHAVVFSARDAAGRWFFTPFSLPTEGSGSVFISPESPLQSVANELMPSLDLPTPSAAGAPAGVKQEWLADLLTLMLSPGVSALIVDGNGRALAALRSLAWVLPPPVRRTLTVSASAVLPPIDGLSGPRIAVIPRGRDGGTDGGAAGTSGSALGRTEGAARHDVVLDFPGGVRDLGGVGLPAGGGGDTTRMQVPYNVYAEFAASALGDREGLARLRSLVEFLERHPPRVELTQARYMRMLQGFAKVEPWLERGIIDVRRDLAESLLAAEDFAFAGMPSAALDILDSVVSTMQDERGADVAQLRTALARVREGTVAGYDRHAEALVFLTEKLRDVVGEIG